MMDSTSKTQKIRIDKWLWIVRIFKTRSLSKEKCNGGKVKIKGTNLKPSHLIKIGDIIQVQKNTIKYKYKVLSLLEKRISSKDVYKFIEDITPEDEILKKKALSMIKVNTRKKGLGRPTKKERRTMEKINKFYNK